ncbi:MAG TPA: DNA-binding domain-containing protein [Solirubrobacteraceae bacterium]|nr:DNA-binding domain-containing protein [Solirubrobacteraceae bacterium]
MTRTLADTQRWFQDVVTDPDGVDAGLARSGAVAVVNGSARLTSRDRLELYSRTYRRRLAGCLRESYPGLCCALGEALFEDFALDYLRARPSRRYTLASLGAGWPAHLEATRPDRDLPPHEREGWPDFLVDLAGLERIFCEVYDAPGAEGHAVPCGADLDAYEPGNGGGGCDGLRIAPVRCLRLLAARFPVDRYLVAVRRGETPPLPAPAATFVAISRRDYVVTMTEIGPAGHRLLEALAGGERLAGAVRHARLDLPEAVSLVRGWADRGLIATIEPPARIRRPTRSGGE